MPFLTKRIRYKIPGKPQILANMKKYNLNYPLNTLISIPVCDLKKIAPTTPNQYVQCICDRCKKQFTVTIYRTRLEDIENDKIYCRYCRTINKFIEKYNVHRLGDIFSIHKNEKEKN